MTQIKPLRPHVGPHEPQCRCECHLPDPCDCHTPDRDDLLPHDAVLNCCYVDPCTCGSGEHRPHAPHCATLQSNPEG